ncbi:hypothetical protein SMG44B_70067 [Stenotrophomonas maltophilia]
MPGRSGRGLLDGGRWPGRGAGWQPEPDRECRGNRHGTQPRPDLRPDWRPGADPLHRTQRDGCGEGDQCLAHGDARRRQAQGVAGQGDQDHARYRPRHAGQVQGNQPRWPGGERHRVLMIGVARHGLALLCSRAWARLYTGRHRHRAPVRLGAPSPPDCPMRVIATALLACLPLSALAAPSYGPRLEGFDYGYPVKTFALESQRQPLEMAYLDIAPKKAPIGVVVLLHGKNFCAATWKESIKPPGCRRLPGDRPGPGGFLQIQQARALPVQLRAAGRQHPCVAAATAAG